MCAKKEPSAVKKEKPKIVPTVGGRSPEEIETKVAVLLGTLSRIDELEESGTLDKSTSEEYRNIIQSTLNLMEWFKGNDVELMADVPVLDKVVLIANDVDLFKKLDLD